jgi:hypothetical protein
MSESIFLRSLKEGDKETTLRQGWEHKLTYIMRQKILALLPSSPTTNDGRQTVESPGRLPGIVTVENIRRRHFREVLETIVVSWAEPTEDTGARRALIPLENKRRFLDVSVTVKGLGMN